MCTSVGPFLINLSFEIRMGLGSCFRRSFCLFGREQEQDDRYTSFGPYLKGRHLKTLHVLVVSVFSVTSVNVFQYNSFYGSIRCCRNLL